jgi:hypothetical protein
VKFFKKFVETRKILDHMIFLAYILGNFNLGGTVQDQDFDYFVQNMEPFYKRYGHKFLAIKNKSVLGVYDSFNSALDETLKHHKAGTFIIQECFKNVEASVNHFQGNVLPVSA